MTQPLVSCLMVTRQRVALARRAVECLLAQTWPNKELVVVDDGPDDYEPMLAAYRDRLPIHYHRLAPDPERKLGGLRNLALDRAHGEMLAQWDDDEWYHPARLETQVRALEARQLDAVTLKWTLMHVDTPVLADRLFRADVGAGTPGTVVHRRVSVRYPNLRRAEDSEFLREVAAHGRVGTLGREASHLFIRCFHGTNTWDAGHFLRRVRRTPAGFVAWLAGRLRGDAITEHPAFALDPRERAAAASFLDESRALGLMRGGGEAIRS